MAKKKIKKVVKKKTVTKKAATKKPPAKKIPAKNGVAKKSSAKKVAVKKVAVKKTKPTVKQTIVKLKSVDLKNFVTPLDDRLIVQVENEERMTAGGLYIPDTVSDSRSFFKGTISQFIRLRTIPPGSAS